MPRTTPRSHAGGFPRTRFASSRRWALVVATLAVWPAAQAATIDVPGDAATIQAGIDMAVAGDTVLVAPGTYNGSATIHVNKRITLASWYHTTSNSSYIDQTIINSTAGTTLDVPSSGAGALVTGFTIMGPDKGIQVMSKADVTHCSFKDTGGDSLSWEDGGAGRFSYNRFVNCGDDCIDSDNDSNGVAGGDRIIEYSAMSGSGDDCIEIRLQDYTGAMMSYYVRYNTIENCTDDGVQLIDYAGASSRRFYIYRNLFRSRGTAGVGATADGSTSQSGAGSPLVEAVQIYNNTIIGQKWGIVGGTNMLVLNNIIKDTTIYALRMLQNQSWAAYNDLFGNAANADATSQPLVGEGMLYADPRLDTTYHLTSGSPCIDAGVAHYERNGQVMDLADVPEGLPDIGAYEYGSGPPPSNQAPSVNAGIDTHIVHPTATVALDGTVTDDGRPGGTLNVTWSKMDGPGTVTFGNAQAVDTSATFSKQGTYRLKLEATDGELTSSDSVVVKYVQAGTGATIDVATPGSTYFEAEGYSWLYAPATAIDDAAASGARTVLSPQGQGTEARAEYTLTFRGEGLPYHVWLRMAGPDATSDSVAVSLNNGSESVVTTTADGSYHWQKMSGSFSSPAGEYPFIVRAAEDGVRWDRIAFSTDAAFVPDDSAATPISARVSASADDAEESSTGSVALTSSDLELITDGSAQVVGMRFAGLAIPPGARIRSASVQFQVDETSSEATTLTIQGQATDDAPTFTTASANVSSRARTAASTLWTPPAWSTVGAAGSDQRTPDLSAIVQEIVGRPGWRSGNAIALIVTGSGRRVAEAYDGDVAGAPLLNVEYTTGGSDTEPPASPAGLRRTDRK